jgi:Phosphatidylinositol-specific phospholipase C, X domain
MSSALTDLSSLQNMKDSTAIMALSVVTIVIMIIALLVYFYYTGTIFSNGLQKKQCSYMDTMYGTVNGKLMSIDVNNAEYQYSFRDYYVKTAYNACSGGKYKNDYVDTCILKNLVKQGVRGFDFEIYSIDDQPVIATSTVDNYCVKETFNSVKFSDAISIIRDYAFTNSTAPNPFDPIILHLRIKSTNQAMYVNFAKILEGYNSILLDKQYSFEYYGKNLGAVKLSEFAGKVVIIVDRSNTSFLESQEFYEYVNMTSNSIFMRALHYYDIMYAPDMVELIEYNKLSMTIGMPDKGSNPDNPSALTMRANGCQLLAIRYQVIDTNLEENNIFFDEQGHAFVLKPEKLRYVPETIPAPPAQDPQLSFATREVSSDFYNFEI